MSKLPIFLLVLAPLQDDRKPGADLDRAKRRGHR